MTLPEVRSALREQATTEQARIALRFFKTGPGEYGEGDEFLGLKVPQVRALVRPCDSLPERDVISLLRSPAHEERLLALLCLVRRFDRGDQQARQHVFDLYLKNTRWISNWDLVDTSAPHIVGRWLLDRDRSVLRRLAASTVLWERRIAVLATQTFIRHRDFADTLEIVRSLLGDTHDLMHKACGWMLREVGNRVYLSARFEQQNPHAALCQFLCRPASGCARPDYDRIVMIAFRHGRRTLLFKIADALVRRLPYGVEP